MNIRLIKRFLALNLIVMFLSCTQDNDIIDLRSDQKMADEYNAEVVLEWYTLIKTLTIQTEGYTPPVAARAFGYTSIALYEGIVPGMPNKVSLSGKLNELEIKTVLEEGKEYHWPTVANAVLAKMTAYFYVNATQERFMAIAALKEKFNQEFLNETGQEVNIASVGLGNWVADEIIEWSSTDGGKDGQFTNFPSDYQPPVGDQYWVPTAPGFSRALQPYWGSNRPFLTANVMDAQPKDAPPTFSVEKSSICYQRALEVYNVVNNLSDEQIKIAEYWSDDPVTTATPPGHSISILNQLIAQNNLSLDVAAEAFAKVGIGTSDAFVSCWKTKFETVYPRPITYINQHIDPEWSPLLGTPPFPEFTSGHSVQSAALAEILTSLFGEDYSFTDHTHEGRTDIDGTARTYANFYAMAEEAAVSRLYGGIHFREAISLGLDQGYQIGRNVSALDLNK